VTAKYFIHLATIDAQVLGKLAVRQFAFLIQANGDGFPRVLVEPTHQSLVKILGDGDVKGHV
jgi:hypothetical protein